MLYGKAPQAIKPNIQTLSRRLLSLPDQVVELLEDGNPHSLIEISKTANLSEKEVEKVLDFLKKYGFARLEKKAKAAQIDPEFLKLLKELD